ncbi:MAG: DUF3616 domain-containing protein [Flammeovirgaceae bacterium]|nr:DUF3616 domain-containing protein [Flammeovirgaceae bacterium]
MFAQMRITEYMYQGANGEFVEFTNVGNTPIDMTGWSFDDDSRIPGSFSLSAFGTVAPGESVILTESNANTFRTAWNLCSGVKIIGGLNQNLGRNDEINLYNASNTLVDRLTYGDQNFPGTIRTQNRSGWVTATGLGVNNPAQWVLSAVSDSESSFLSAGNDIGSPGKSTRATVAFDPCAPPPTSAPTISEVTTSYRIQLPTSGGGALSGVIGDATDFAATQGIDFHIDDTDTPIGNLTVAVTSSNTTVVPNANLILSGTGNNRNLKIIPAAVGYAAISLTVSDGTNNTTYTIQYAASEGASVSFPEARFHTGKCDASTAIAIDTDYMLVADDEDQTIRLYHRSLSGMPAATFDFTSLLNLSGSSEVDIEASTRAGNKIFWIGSHSNNTSGAHRPNRERIFVTNVSGTGLGTTLTFNGYYQYLESDLIAWDNANGHGLGAGALGLAVSAANGVLPEQPNGFNIEGLTFAPNSTTTAYVAMRAPLQSNKALIIPVTNFDDLPNNNTSGRSNFGSPIFLDLGGRAIRSIECNAQGCLIIAGPAGVATGVPPHDFRLYTWSGSPTDVPQLRSADLTALLSGGSFESIVELPATLNANAIIQVLSDNGDTIWYGDGIISKDLPNAPHKKFRSDKIKLGYVVGAVPFLTVVTATKTTVTLSWSDLDGEANYQLERCEVNTFDDATLQVFSIASNQTNYTDTTVTPGKTYYYRLRAVYND